MSDKKRILIVEDEKDMAYILKMNIEKAGKYEVIVAYDGQQGLAMAQKQYPDLIILDLMLPKLDGYTVCRMLKFSDKHKHTPVIVFTVRTQDADKKLAQDCGADAYIPKILGQEVLMDRIKKLLHPLT